LIVGVETPTYQADEIVEVETPTYQADEIEEVETPDLPGRKECRG
jgi:hypothetical protein